MNDLGDTIRKAFRTRGGSALSLAKETGIPYSGLHRFLTGAADIRLSTVNRLCDALGLELRPRRKKESTK